MPINAPSIMRSRVISREEQEAVHEALQDFAQMQLMRYTFQPHWEEVAELILPHFRNTFMYGNYNWPGAKKTDRQVDASGAMALHRFGAICDSLMSPANDIYEYLTAEVPEIKKDRACRLWYQQATQILFSRRYAATAGFIGQNQQVWQMLGAFGTGPMFTDAFDGPERGLRYKALPLGEWFHRENHQGIVDGGIRWMRMTAQQAQQKWPEAQYGPLPEALQNALTQQSQMLFNFIHRIVPRNNLDTERWDYLGKKWTCQYVSMEGKCLMEPESGYRTFPVSVARADQAPTEVYGRSVAMMVLPSLKTLNAQKTTFLKAGHRAADPIYLGPDDGIVDFSARPGAFNKGGMSAEGKRLVDTLPPGDIQITKEMMDVEKGIVDDAFWVSIFQILTETPQMTATEVIERTREKGILIAPGANKQFSEYQGPKTHRELDILASQGALPPMPPLLREARGHYMTVSTSPLAKAAQAQKAAGFMRSVETTKELVAVTQDPSLLDVYDFDTANRSIADINQVPEDWMSDDDAVKQKRQARAKQQQIQQRIQAAPAQAAMMKAQAVQAKAGMGQGQDEQQQQGAPQQ